MKEAITLSMLKIIYPDQWVLIGNPKEADGDISGILILHHQSKRELADQFSKRPNQFNNTILRFTGTKPALGKRLRFTPLN